MDHGMQALVVAGSEQLRESLLVLLRAIPRIKSVYQADDGPTALATYPDLAPDLVLLDYDLSPEEASATIRKIKVSWPRTRCVALIDDEQDRQIAEMAGANIALVKGILAARLIEMIEGLLPSET